MLRRSEETIKVQKTFLQRQAREENRLKGLLLNNRSDNAIRQRRFRYSKR